MSINLEEIVLHQIQHHVEGENVAITPSVSEQSEGLWRVQE